MNRLECIVSDLDESLLGPDKKIGAEDLETIRRLKKKGVYFFIATGRHFSLVRQLAWQTGFDLPAICCNGGHVYDFLHQATLMAKVIEPEAAAKMKGYLDGHGQHYIIYTPEAPFFTPGNPRLEFWEHSNAISEPENRAELRVMDGSFRIGDHQIIKFLVPQADDAMQRRFDEFNVDGKLEILSSGRGLLDINAAGVTKGVGISFLAKHFGFSLENTLALGDNYNDEPMMTLCGYPVAPENGEEAVKAQARFITAHHSNSPLTHAVRALFPGLL